MKDQVEDVTKLDLFLFGVFFIAMGTLGLAFMVHIAGPK